MLPAPSEPEVILRALVEHGVEFIVIGGVAAVLQGAPIYTFDLDLVHRRTPENVARLLAALGALEARYRIPGHEHRPPDPEAVSSNGHHLLMTSSGPLDLLGHVVTDRGYEELLPHTVEIDLSAGLRVRVLDLETVIDLKVALGRDKDRATVAVLRRTLEETRKGA